MKSKPWIPLLLACLPLSVWAASPSPKPSSELGLESAIREFETSAKRLEKTLSESTKAKSEEVRKDLNDTTSTLLRDLTQMMNKLTEKLQTRQKPRAEEK